MAKFYDIYCITKANGHQYLHRRAIFAENVKDAKREMKELIEADYGRHAFSIGTKPGGEWKWESYAENHGVSMGRIRESAFSCEGFMIC